MRQDVLRRLAHAVRQEVDAWSLPRSVRRQVQLDRGGPKPSAGPIGPAIDAAYDWLAQAQDATGGGGVARDYSILRGAWSAAYPETTGYIVPTMIAYGRRQGSADALERARRMLDWLVSLQFPEGGFPGGRVDQTPRVPVTFNTGQILIGLAYGRRAFGDRYAQPMLNAARWLRDTIDADGCWRRHATPFATPGEKTYETHVAWGLFEADREAPGEGFAETGRRNVNWALTHQRANGWFEKCCLSDPAQPLTHTLGYVVRGVLEAYERLQDARYLDAALLTARGLLGALESDGRLPGRLDAQWRPAANWVCLTGSAQVAYVWLRLHQLTGEAAFLDAGRRANAFVRRTVSLDGPPETRGGVRGSFPIDGAYGRFEYLNWAAKFFIDSHFLEQDIAGDAA